MTPLKPVDFGLTILVLGSGIAAGIIAPPPLVLIALGLIAVGAVSAAAPRAAVVVAIPIMVLAGLLPGFGTPMLVAVGASQGSVLLRCRRDLQIAPTVAVLLLPALLTISYMRTEGGFVVTAEAARNTLLSTLIGLALVLSAMAAQVGRTAMLQALAVTGLGACLYLLSTGSFAGGRITTEALNANSVGHIAALALLAARGACLASGKPQWLLCAAPATMLLVLSQSRGALVIAALGIIVPSVLSRPPATRSLLAVSVAVLLYMAWPVISGGLAELLASRVHTETEARFDVLQLALRAIGENPLAGLGWRTFPDYSYIRLGVPRNTHNEYVRIGAEAGLPALAALVALAIMGLRQPVVDSTDQALKGVLVGGLAALAFANTLSTLVICMSIWLALGATFADQRDPTERSSSGG